MAPLGAMLGGGAPSAGAGGDPGGPPAVFGPMAPCGTAGAAEAAGGVSLLLFWQPAASVAPKGSRQRAMTKGFLIMVYLAIEVHGVRWDPAITGCRKERDLPHCRIQKYRQTAGTCQYAHRLRLRVLSKWKCFLLTVVDLDRTRVHRNHVTL